MIRDITQACFEFLWGSRHPKIHRDITITPRDAGGLGFPDVPATFAAFGLRLLVRFWRMLRLPDAEFNRAPSWVHAHLATIGEHQVQVRRVFASEDGMFTTSASRITIRRSLATALPLLVNAVVEARHLHPTKVNGELRLQVVPSPTSLRTARLSPLEVTTSSIARQLSSVHWQVRDFTTLWSSWSPGGVPSAASTFKRCWHPTRPPAEASVLFLALHDRLPVGCRIRHFTTHIHCPACPVVVETQQHILFDCPTAQAVWLSVSILISTFLSTPPTIDITPTNALLVTRPAVPRGLFFPAPLWHILHSCAFATLWFARCKAVYEHRPALFSHTFVSSLFRSRLRRRLALAPFRAIPNINRIRSIL